MAKIHHVLYHSICRIGRIAALELRAQSERMHRGYPNSWNNFLRRLTMLDVTKDFILFSHGSPEYRSTATRKCFPFTSKRSTLICSIGCEAVVSMSVYRLVGLAVGSDYSRIF